MSTIPARDIVAVNPGVLAAGGSALDMIGLLLTNSTRVPIGAVQPFASATDVADYFGAGSTEASLASVYFLGFDNSTKKPGSILFAQYPSTAVSAWLRGFNTGLSLTELKALPSGTIAVTVSGVLKTSGSIDLSAATSFSNAATIIQAAFTSPGFAVTYDSTSGGFVFTNTATGASSTITAATTSALATSLKLTTAAGAITSQGADAAVPGPFMDGVIAVTQDWATFMTLFDPDGGSGNANKLLFAAWTNAQNNQYAYVAWDTDITATNTQPATSSLGYLLNQNNDSGTFAQWAADATEGPKKAAFICGAAASIDFTRLNGRITFAFRSQTGLVADVTNQSIAHNLGGDPQSIGSRGNYYNFYGAYATRNDQFVWENRGFVSGPFLWFDSYINQIWLNNALQLSLMVLLGSVNSIPYNTEGYALIEAACKDPILAALNFGAIRAGITLSSSQVAQVNSSAGIDIADTIQQRGWYLQISDAQPQVRAARASPPCTLWYTDGQSIQSVTLASIEIQ
jgi:hypothetical protein